LELILKLFFDRGGHDVIRTGKKRFCSVSNLQLQSIPESIGSTITGGGMVVSGPSDVNMIGLMVFSAVIVRIGKERAVSL
jgi:hypothetical protein